ncbi:hypothetical protein [Exiguobacterium flavidum]|uniref:hypothetical protein n=1 Tax=Exiguobacterium flavidum TaxID=2184695 RepID=UPI000DF7606A|nr:hypothetical protein [Exiguobacterium flavidum]
MNYWYHFKRAFLPIALLLFALAAYQMLYRMNNIWLSLVGLVLVFGAIYIVVRNLRKKEEE